MNRVWPVLFKIRIHPLTWFLLALAVLTARFGELLLLFGIVLIHELGHAFAAHYLGWRIKSVTILPFGGEMETEEHGNRPSIEEACVLLAGPLQHIWIFFVAVLVHQNGWISDYLYKEWMTFNIVIFLVNLLPIWPLDGGKLLFILFSRYMPFMRAHKAILMFSCAILLFCAILLAFLNPLNLNWWLILGFLIFSNWREWKQRSYVFMRFLLERYYGRHAKIQTICSLEAEKDEMIFKILEGFKKSDKHIIVVKNKEAELGKLDEAEVLHACFSEKQAYRPIGELLYYY